MAFKTIKKGSSGAEVSEWQGLLTAAGYPTPVTGKFDDETDKNTRSWQAAHGLVADGIAGNASWSAMTGKPSFPAAYGKDAKFGRDTLNHVWQSVLDEGLQSQYPEVRALAASSTTLGEQQMIQAEAELESHYGWAQYTNKLTGEKSGVINNWGAVQAGKPPCDPAKAFEASDTHADGTAYTWCYKKYPTPEDGARDLLRQFTLRRPTGWALAKLGDIDGAQIAWNQKDPITGVGLYFEQNPSQRSKGIQERVWAIADALGEPIAAKRGGPMPVSSSGEPITGVIPESVTDPATDNQKTLGKVLIAALAAWLGYKYILR